MRVRDAFGHSRRARAVDDVEQITGLDRYDRSLIAVARQQLSPAGPPGRLASGKHEQAGASGHPRSHAVDSEALVLGDEDRNRSCVADHAEQRVDHRQAIAHQHDDAVAARDTARVQRIGDPVQRTGEILPALALVTADDRLALAPPATVECENLGQQRRPGLESVYFSSASKARDEPAAAAHARTERMVRLHMCSPWAAPSRRGSFNER